MQDPSWHETASRASYALPSGIPALQTEPVHVGRVGGLVVIGMLAFGGATGFLAGRLGAWPDQSADSVRPSQFITIPETGEFWDAPSLDRLAGVSGRAREQILINPSHLAEMVGHELTGLWFRRDSSWGMTSRGGLMRLRLRLSMSNVDANSPSEWFEKNLSSVTRGVFAGLVLIPSSPAMTSTEAASWYPEHTVRIEFDSPFTYTGGTLVVDLVGMPDVDAPTAFWPVDADMVSWGGPNGRSIGEACGNYQLVSNVSGPHCIGDTIQFATWGAPNTLAVLLLGSRLRTPIDLAFLGAPGCSLYVQPSFHAFGRVSEERVGSGVAGVSIEIQLPSRLDLLGRRLSAQWVNLERSLPLTEWSNPAGFTASDAYEFVINTHGASLGLSTVISDDFETDESPPAKGYVRTNMGPVLRFLYR